MTKKILITYASYGNGHKSEAEYIYDYLLTNEKKIDLKLIDVMDYGTLIAKIDKNSFNMNYKLKGNHLLFSLAFELSNNKVVTSLYKILPKFLFKSKLKEDILDYKPDIVISTHFFGSIIMGMLNKKYHLKTKIITIIPDFEAHAFWLKNYKYEDAIIVSNNLVKNDLIKFGIPKKKIYSFGIPLATKFKNLDNIQEIKKKYQINNKKITFLFLGGGAFGSTFAYDYFQELVKANLNINLIFVAGNNQELKEKCLECSHNHNLPNTKVLGFTKDIPNLLNIADVVITKPGGLSVMEAISIKTPMILIPGNGGPENYNAKYIKNMGFGLIVHTPKSLLENSLKLLQNPDLILNMKKNLEKCEDNKAMEKLYNLIKKWM